MGGNTLKGYPLHHDLGKNTGHLTPWIWLVIHKNTFQIHNIKLTMFLLSPPLTLSRTVHFIFIQSAYSVVLNKLLLTLPVPLNWLLFWRRQEHRSSSHRNPYGLWLRSCLHIPYVITKYILCLSMAFSFLWILPDPRHPFCKVCLRIRSKWQSVTGIPVPSPSW